MESTGSWSDFEKKIFRLLTLFVVSTNAFRRDIFQIDTQAHSLARSGDDMRPLLDRLQVLGEVLDYHAKGEEAAVFPAVDKLTPFVSQAYFIDHRELDNMVNGLETIRKAPDPLTTARATAVLQSHLRIHLDKEDVHLYPILRERTTNERQASIAKIMSSKIPPEKFPTFTQWLFPLLELNDQITVTKGWMALMPPPVFAMAKQLIKKSAAENWAKLTQQIPELTN
ncbi:MAG: hemerythrin domain-containing protein [Candidatus Bathyarchaeota archaeon]|nr:hemerythrin domain-containing protein [Candidatus Bathyarchaeota archaeon]